MREILRTNPTWLNVLLVILPILFIAGACWSVTEPAARRNLQRAEEHERKFPVPKHTVTPPLAAPPTPKPTPATGAARAAATFQARTDNRTKVIYANPPTRLNTLTPSQATDRIIVPHADP